MLVQISEQIFRFLTIPVTIYIYAYTMRLYKMPMDLTVHMNIPPDVSGLYI